ncbi:hypothetical protein [Streptococcus gordonii]|uniref:hypothetical protein n=1 Tax=Streptococcus gordonii TaxID=1302 RepID=UPI0002D8EE83|nr:hypothetical protein [Streptococcus gordonii]MBZ2137514.1 hypothetical protein [Streptococcus gordonii]QGS43249.1 hypothetical protein FOB91_00420 [Streptococcus gordonii]
MSLNHRYYAKGETNPDVIHYMSGFFLAGMTQMELSGVSRDDRLNSSALYPKF